MRQPTTVDWRALKLPLSRIGVGEWAAPPDFIRVGDRSVFEIQLHAGSLRKKTPGRLDPSKEGWAERENT